MYFISKNLVAYIYLQFHIEIVVKVIPSTLDMHVATEGAKKYIVNLNTMMSSCGRFQHYEIPCGHVIAVLRYRKLHEADFCSAFYSLKNFEDAYVIPVEPIPCESTWDIPSYISEPKMMLPGPKRSGEDQNMNSGTGLLMWNSKGRKSPAVDAVKFDTIKRHVQIILCKINNFLPLHLFLYSFEC